jgi:hypothetical protein
MVCFVTLGKKILYYTIENIMSFSYESKQSILLIQISCDQENLLPSQGRK